MMFLSSGFRAVTILCAATAFLAIGANILCLRCLWKARALTDSNTKLLLNQLVLCNAASTFYIGIKTTSTLLGVSFWFNRSVAECYMADIPGYVAFVCAGFWTFVLLSIERLTALKSSQTEPSKRSRNTVRILNVLLWIYSIGNPTGITYLTWSVLSNTIVPYCTTYQFIDIAILKFSSGVYLVGCGAFLCLFLYMRSYVKSQLEEYRSRQLPISLERRTLLERTRHFSEMMIYGTPCLLLGWLPAMVYMTVPLPAAFTATADAHMISYQIMHMFPFVLESLFLALVFMFFNPVLRAHVPFFAGKSWNDRVMEQERDQQNIHAHVLGVIR